MKDIEGNFILIDGQVKTVQEFKEENLIKGKTIYEVIRVIQGKPLFYNLHFERLHNSAILAGIKFNIKEAELKAQLKTLIDLNSIEFGNVKTAYNNGNLYAFKIKHRYPVKADFDNGVATVLFMAERKDPNIKSIDTEFRARANERIKEENVYEAILVDKNGYITEGSRSNIFMVKGNKIVTSPASQVLPGITRNTIIFLAKKLGLTVLEDRIGYMEIGKMDALFISGTSTKVLPVNKVENINFNSNSNIIIKNIRAEYDKFTAKDIDNFQYKENA